MDAQPIFFQDKNFILASQSPRRRQLIQALGLKVTCIGLDVNEDYPAKLKGRDVPIYLCQKKALGYSTPLPENTILITADTVVSIDDLVLNKPNDRDDALKMLGILSNRKHTVFTGVCLRSAHKIHTFCQATDVYFKALSPDEITYYVDNYQPYDKAGSYGVQEWIGYIGIEKIEGSFYNVMGLPVKELFEQLMGF